MKREVYTVHYFNGKEMVSEEFIINPTKEEVAEATSKFLNDEYEKGNVRFEIIDLTGNKKNK